MNKQKKILIIGGGISGLSVGYHLKNNYHVTIAEAQAQPGGCIQTATWGQGYVRDVGPNSTLFFAHEANQLKTNLNLHEQMIQAGPEATKRYIYRNGRLHSLSQAPPKLLTTRLFSLKGKLRMAMEPWVRTPRPTDDESVADFVTRRFGHEMANYALDPLVSGIYAGQAHKLSVRAAFKAVDDLEKNYGSVIKGGIRVAKQRKKKGPRHILSFKGGMQVLPNALATALGNRLKLNTHIVKLQPPSTPNGMWLAYDQAGNTLEAHTVICTLPAWPAAELLESITPHMAQMLRQIEHPQVMVWHLAFPKQNITHPLDSFGFLIPSKEKQPYLGAVWNSVIFNNRAPTDVAAFTLFVGGAHHPNPNFECLTQQALPAFKQLMGIAGPPVLNQSQIWPAAIPQYNLGHLQRQQQMALLLQQTPNLWLCGNYAHGVSVADCYKKGKALAQALADNKTATDFLMPQ